MELTKLDKEVIASADVQTEMVVALLTIPPLRLRMLAKWFERSDFLKESEGTEVQDDLRKMADLSEEVLSKISKEYEKV